MNEKSFNNIFTVQGPKFYSHQTRRHVDTIVINAEPTCRFLFGILGSAIRDNKKVAYRSYRILVLMSLTGKVLSRGFVVILDKSLFQRLFNFNVIYNTTCKNLLDPSSTNVCCFKINYKSLELHTRRYIHA